MSSDLAFSKNRRPGQLLQPFLESGHTLFAAEPARLLGPLMDFLAEFHGSGQAHGAVMPGRLLLSPAGEWDVDFFKTRAGSPDALELETYYPDGPGQSLEERQRRDVRALAAVLHLIVTDQPPARRSRRAQRLAEHPLAQDWPAEFIELLDRILEAGPEEPLPALAELAASLGKRGDNVQEPAADTLPPGTAESAAAAAEPDPAAAAADGPATLFIPPIPQKSEMPPPPTPPVPAWPLLPAVRLPNAMVGRAYAVEVSALEHFPQAGAGTENSAPAELLTPLPPGLIFSAGLLSGTPDQAGEFEIRLRSHPGGSAPENVPGADHVLLLTINASPQSLWKNLPSDPAGKFAKPDTETRFLAGQGMDGRDRMDKMDSAKEGDAGPLVVIGASLRGRSHAHVGSFRDDDLAMDWFPASAWYVLTVADGAGSAKFAREGSRVACEVVRAYFEEKFGTGAGADVSLTKLAEEHAASPDDPAAADTVRKELIRQFGGAAFQAKQTLEAAAEEHQAELRDFHTTLITVLLHPLADGRWFAAAFSIGDGAAAVTGVPGGAPCLLTRADSGDYAGQTVFLTMDQALATPEAVAARVQTAVLPGFEALLLVTDGISDPRFVSDTALADPAGWSRLWEEIRPVLIPHDSGQAQAEALLDWMGFHSPGHHDDRTLVLAVPPSSLTPLST
ncbi:MAG: protein phosphatase 2C domain-containing protein [Verrucomicrobiota bacterium]